jgi:hypothetical protein
MKVYREMINRVNNKAAKKPYMRDEEEPHEQPLYKPNGLVKKVSTAIDYTIQIEL